MFSINKQQKAPQSGMTVAGSLYLCNPKLQLSPTVEGRFGRLMGERAEKTGREKENESRFNKYFPL